MATTKNPNNLGEITNENGAGYDGIIWLDYAPRGFNAWAIVEEAARLASIIQASPEKDHRVLSAEINGLALALELLSGHEHAEEYPEADGRVAETSWREMIDAHAEANPRNGREITDEDLPWAEEIEALGAAEALDALDDEEYQADGEVFDALSEHIGRNIRRWYDEARAAGDDTLAGTLADIAADVYDEDLRAGDETAATVAAWRRDPRNANLDALAEFAAEDANTDDSPWAAGVFEGIARAILAALAEATGGDASGYKEAVYKAYNVAW